MTRTQWYRQWSNFRASLDSEDGDLQWNGPKVYYEVWRSRDLFKESLTSRLWRHKDRLRNGKKENCPIALEIIAREFAELFKLQLLGNGSNEGMTNP